jgi:hypothetical protein
VRIRRWVCSDARKVETVRADGTIRVYSWATDRRKPITCQSFGSDFVLDVTVNPSLGAWAPATAVPRSASACFFLHVIGLPPYTIEVGFPHVPVKTISRRIPFSRLQPFRYVQAPRFARLPDRSYRYDLSPQGSRGFYVRAEHASLPPHASDMLTTRPGNWWCGDLHPTRFTALSAAPV